MTFRLVGLMSLVLLVSLAAFAFLMNSYQAGVMDEVTRTVSAVGKATLQTFEITADALDVAAAAGTAESKNLQGGEFIYQIRTESPGGETTGASTGKVLPTSGGEAPKEPDEKVLRTAGGGVAIVHLGDRRIIRSSTTAVPTEKGKQVLIRIEEVHAESDPTHGTVLRIPTWTVEDVDLPGPGATAGGGTVGAPGGKTDRKATGGDTASIPPGAMDVDEGPGTGVLSIPGEEPGAGGGASPVLTGGRTIVLRTAGKPAAAILSSDGVTDITAPAAREDLLVTVPTHDFQNLFTAYRRRTLLFFLAIFVVGTALSAGLAARFTRPVRRLDAGIRRLAEGDLEVQVPATGQDEIGRLARAFNEMARRLRAGRERERDLRRREKLSALGRMAAGVAHDVRNPLHSINLTLQNLEETARPGEADRVREFDRSVGIIREEIRRLDRLVENFLRFARSDRTARVPVDLARLARETAQLVEKEAERRRVRVEVIAAGEPGVVEGNMESLRSSVLNLVLNSFEAMPEGGTLTLTAGSAEGEARLEVADTGRGIPAEEQEKVFEFAYTTREEGHGMGLAMVHQVVVEEHGGRVALESRPGEGTRVLLAFPTGGTGSPLPRIGQSCPK